MKLTRVLHQVRLLTRLNVIDNSEIGSKTKQAKRPVKLIRVYNKSKRNMGGLGDLCLCTIMGEMKKGIIVGCRQTQKAFVPQTDTNNVVLLDNNKVPIGTRINGPVPNIIRERGAFTARLMAIASKQI